MSSQINSIKLEGNLPLSIKVLNNRMNPKFSFLHARLRTATLRNDAEGQAVLINCLLRNYLHYHLYDQADKLVSKSIFPELASNNEWARHFYYLGRIKAIQLEYSAANKHLLQAIRKAPQHTAVGFKQTVCKINNWLEFCSSCNFRCKN